MDITTLRRASSALSSAAAILPGSDLLPEERMALGSHLLPCGPVLAEEVARAVAACPAAFADLPLSPAALRARQAEADAWGLLRHQLEDLLARAVDHHLAAQSDATQCALRLLDRVRGEAALDGPRPAPRAAARTAALAGAELVLRSYRRGAARAAAHPRPAPATRRRLDAGLGRLFLRHLQAERARKR